MAVVPSPLLHFLNGHEPVKKSTAAISKGFS